MQIVKYLYIFETNFADSVDNIFETYISFWCHNSCFQDFLYFTVLKFL